MSEMNDREWARVKEAIVRWWPQHAAYDLAPTDLKTGKPTQPSMLDGWRQDLLGFEYSDVYEGLKALCDSGATIKKPLDLPLVLAHVRQAAVRRAALAKHKDPTGYTPPPPAMPALDAEDRWRAEVINACNGKPNREELVLAHMAQIEEARNGDFSRRWRTLQEAKQLCDRRDAGEAIDVGALDPELRAVAR